MDAVVKVGGSLLANTTHLDAVLHAIAAASRERRLLVVPGGGPFADTVRDVAGRAGLPDTAAHWMAVLAMDQYGHLLASRLRGGMVVARPPEIAAALERGDVPVLAPAQWLQEHDPLPHSWDVTGDSIAAWVAGAVGATRLVLVKPALSSEAVANGPRAGGLVDSYFPRALPSGVASSIVAADRIEALASALRGHL